MIKPDWPPWAREKLDLRPDDATTRLVLADWLGDNDGDPVFCDFLRWAGFAPKYPAPRKLSRNVNNLAMGWGWFTQSDARPQSVVPAKLWPSKLFRFRNGSSISYYDVTRDWVWSTARDAENWLFSRWVEAGREVQDELLAGVNLVSCREG